MRAADWFTILHGTTAVIELEVTYKSVTGTSMDHLPTLNDVLAQALGCIDSPPLPPATPRSARPLRRFVGVVPDESSQGLLIVSGRMQLDGDGLERIHHDAVP